MNEKRCSRCKRIKLAGEFQARNASWDGLTAACKACLSKYEKKRAMAPHRVQARAIYMKTPNGKHAHVKAVKKWRVTNKLRYWAHCMLNNALRNGEIVKATRCQNCGKVGKLEGHHSDYYQPLLVQWLCNLCHRRKHA